MFRKSPIAVIAMSGVFPESPDIRTFWHNIIHRKNASADIPRQRWGIHPDRMTGASTRPDKSVSTKACLIRDFDFDPNGYPIDPELLRGLDPLHHLVLHAVRTVLSDVEMAGTPTERVGAILAAIALPTDAASGITRKIFSNYYRGKTFSACGRDSEPLGPTDFSAHHTLASRVTGFPAAILSEAFGFGAGTYTLDAACASSLYAVKLACDELHAHHADMMITGGVSRPENLYTQVGFSQLQAISPSGRCAPFDRTADGLVVGEGVGILVLKRLDDAIRAGDRIHAVIRGIGLSNDMRGNLLAPEINGQIRAMESAYRCAGWRPGDVDLIECHGTGTPLGDRVELESMARVWENDNGGSAPCWIGSVKSMIGHLLTAAGAAGLIKTILAFEQKTLPPSLHYTEAPDDSPIHQTSFQVLTAPQPWNRKSERGTRKAAVSAFGFGGINAHLLLDEWPADSSTPMAPPSRSAISDHRIGRFAPRIVPTGMDTAESMPPKTQPSLDIAIVGMETIIGDLPGLQAFRQNIFTGNSSLHRRPENRWSGADSFLKQLLSTPPDFGAFIDEIALEIGKYPVPPLEIPQILPQQLLAMKAAAGAMQDAGISSTAEHPEISSVIAINFDFETTDFYLRWHMPELLRKWNQELGRPLDADTLEGWTLDLQNHWCPPLNATRTLGALGSIVASRIAKAFRFGGPCFSVSCEEAGGLQALNIGIRNLQQRESDSVVVGAVDFPGDPRNVLLRSLFQSYAPTADIHPFDKNANGCLPGEGAAAIVIKRLDDAEQNGDRIYAVIRGMGYASGPGAVSGRTSEETCLRSITQAFEQAGISPAAVDYIETNGNADPQIDAIEITALQRCFQKHGGKSAIGAVSPLIGHAGAVSGLAAAIKACVCLSEEMLPPLSGFQSPQQEQWHQGPFYFPRFPSYWHRDRIDGARYACVSSLTCDGNAFHMIMGGHDSEKKTTAVSLTADSSSPSLLPLPEYGLFVVDGNDGNDLLEGLNALESNLREEQPRAPMDAGNKDGHLFSARQQAADWYRKNPPRSSRKFAVAILARNLNEFHERLAAGRKAVMQARSCGSNGGYGVWYSPRPIAARGALAFVYPGSGNHYPGMGRQLGVVWPEIMRQMDIGTDRFKSQCLPAYYVPQQSDWTTGWEQRARTRIQKNPHVPIFGQVVFGCMMTDLFARFGVAPDAVIGYSLGESTGLFATGAWPDRGQMLERMNRTQLFARELAGEYRAIRQAWAVPEDHPFQWAVAVVNRGAEKIRPIVARYPNGRLLIVNSPEECVIGGGQGAVTAIIEDLGCEAVYLDGVVTVHCDAIAPVAEEYRELHRFPVTPHPDIRYYSCFQGASYIPDTESAADSILQQARAGFDFTRTIGQAYDDGARLFLEIGPYSSCTRMIHATLADRPHASIAASVRNVAEEVGFLRAIGRLIAERIPVDLEFLHAGIPAIREAAIPQISSGTITRPVGKPASDIPVPVVLTKNNAKPNERTDSAVPLENRSASSTIKVSKQHQRLPAEPIPPHDLWDGIHKTGKAHSEFLAFSDLLSRTFADAYTLHAALLHQAIEMHDGSAEETMETSHESETSFPEEPPPQNEHVYSREMCMEFAVGSVANVFGPEFSIIDTYPVRVRLPDEPLMLVDRVMEIEGEKGVLGSGRIVTEHDVRENAWYLDGDRAPLCISVEAGQADLFLSSYLGIDFHAKGKRAYRLLDATVQFYRGLPRPGETIRYDIDIDRFVRQGETYLFFFRFRGEINGAPLITMTDGCAGFFTAEEVRNSGGVILTEKERELVPGTGTWDQAAFVEVQQEAYTGDQLDRLRAGELAACFGPAFQGMKIADSLRIPGGKMKLIDRVIALDPSGGRYGNGWIQAEADIDPKAWFLTCHFVDDMVMPGTLMYECCAHTLRIFLQRMGWITDKEGVVFEPLKNLETKLRCRGPVTPETKCVRYEVEIREIGFTPEPYVIADAHMFADDHRIVRFDGVSLKLTGTTKKDLQEFWHRPPPRGGKSLAAAKKPLFGQSHILAFARGNPSEAFGEPYRPFDRDRFIARLPAPPYSFIHRVVDVESEPWILAPGGWARMEYDVSPEDWYFKADRNPSMPYCVLLEIALQSCGWLAAYMGSALKSEKDLRFRNLEGTGTLHREIPAAATTLATRSRLQKVSSAGDLIIEEFEFIVLDGTKPVFDGTTSFGFFTENAMAQQKGVQKDILSWKTPAESENGSAGISLSDTAPMHPDDDEMTPGVGPNLPSRALRMVDRIDTCIPDGGPAGLGYIRGSKFIDPAEWFFQAHFYQDPVCPGSLGVESFIQLLKYMARQKWPNLPPGSRFASLTGNAHSWIYRGQIRPNNRLVVVDAMITEIREQPVPTIVAEGRLMVDGLHIYSMKDIGICLRAPES